MAEITFSAFVDRTQEVPNSIVEVWVDASANNIYNNVIYSKTLLSAPVFTDPTTCEPSTGLGSVFGVKEIYINQPGDVLANFEWSFNFDGLAGIPAGVLVVNFSFCNGTTVVYPNKLHSLLDENTIIENALLVDTSANVFFTINSPKEYNCANPTEFVGCDDSNANNKYNLVPVGIYQGIINGAKSTGSYFNATGSVIKLKLNPKTAPNKDIAALREYIFDVKLAPEPVFSSIIHKLDNPAGGLVGLLPGLLN
jgi:hypothetical protein